MNCGGLGVQKFVCRPQKVLAIAHGVSGHVHGEVHVHGQLHGQLHLPYLQLRSQAPPEAKDGSVNFTGLSWGKTRGWG